MSTQLIDPATQTTGANWVANATVLWEQRRVLVRVAVIGLIMGLLIAFLIPKRYTSSGRIMPPENASPGAAILAALGGHGLGELGGLGALAGGLLGGRNSSALFVELLRSGAVSGRLIDRFHLQQVWHKRYRIDTAKYLARHTSVVEDKLSGVITVEVVDTDPRRARDLAQGYLDELNLLVNRTNTSSAHQERIFIEQRLQGVHADLERAQQDLSEFSSTHTTIDLPDQTRAMVDAASRLEAEEIVQQSEADSLRQVYGDTNVRVRAAEARIADLKKELVKMSGTSAPLTDSNAGDPPGEAKNAELYPPLRQLPRLGVPYADLYRRVRVQEAVYELLTQQYEISRIEEAKDVPVVSVIDTPGIPEKKSFPPRLLVALLFTMAAESLVAMGLLVRHRWNRLSADDPRRVLAAQMAESVRSRIARLAGARGGVS